MSSTAFSSLHLKIHMLKNLTSLGYTEMTPIQAHSLPLILAGKDVIAKAKTGSGKTAAFGIGLLSRLVYSLFTRAGAGAVPDPGTGRSGRQRAAPPGPFYR